MVEPMSEAVPRCPWCSAPLTAADAERCPSCGAALTVAGGAEPVLPGINAIDPQAILRAKTEPPRPRNRLLSFLSGEVAVDTDAASAGSLAPPPDQVRREMLRLQLDAERVRLEAEQLAAQNDAIVDAIDSGRIILAPPEAASAAVSASAATGPATAPAADASPASEAATTGDTATAAPPDPGTQPAS